MKEASCKDHILYDSTYLECLEKANLHREKAPQWWPRSRIKEGNKSQMGRREFTEVRECLLTGLITKIIKLYT